MPSVYPNNYDIWSTKVDDVDYIFADHVNKLQDAVRNIEYELGLNIKGNTPSLKSRLATATDEYGNIVDWYNANGNLNIAEVVIYDVNYQSTVKTTNVKNSPNVVGVVTTSAASGQSVPICTHGTIAVRMIAEDSDIVVGDWLTTSSIPGYATKASPESRTFLGKSNVALTVGTSGIYIMNVDIAGGGLVDHTHTNAEGDGGLLGDNVVDNRIINNWDDYTLLNVTSENITVTGGLYAEAAEIGHLVLDDVEIANNVTVSGNLIVLGSEFISASEVISGDQIISNNLIIEGDSYLGIDPFDETRVYGQLYVANTFLPGVTSPGTLNLGKIGSNWEQLQFDGSTFSLTNSLTISGDLTVIGSTLLTNPLYDNYVFVSANGINKTLNQAIIDEDITGGGEYANEPNDISYIATQQFSVSGNLVDRYYTNRHIELVGSGFSTFTTMVSGSFFSYPNTIVTMQSGAIDGSLEKVRFYASGQESLGIIDVNNPNNIVLANHVADVTIHSSGLTGLVQEDLTSQVGGGNDTFVFSNSFKEDTSQVYLNGERQRLGTDYTESVVSKSVIFTVAPTAPDTVYVSYEFANLSSTYKFNDDLTSQQTGLNKIFNTTYNFRPGSTMVYKNGERFRLDTDYTETGTDQITMTTIPNSGTDLIIDYDANASGNTFNIGQISFNIDGTLTGATTDITGTLIGRLGTITEVQIGADNAPTGSALIIDINNNGTTIFTNPANRPQLSIGSTYATFTTIDVPSITKGDKLTIDIDQVGSTISGGEKLYINILTREI